MSSASIIGAVVSEALFEVVIAREALSSGEREILRRSSRTMAKPVRFIAVIIDAIINRILGFVMWFFNLFTS